MRPRPYVALRSSRRTNNSEAKSGCQQEFERKKNVPCGVLDIPKMEGGFTCRKPGAISTTDVFNDRAQDFVRPAVGSVANLWRRIRPVPSFASPRLNCHRVVNRNLFEIRFPLSKLHSELARMFSEISAPQRMTITIIVESRTARNCAGAWPVRSSLAVLAAADEELGDEGYDEDNCQDSCAINSQPTIL